VNCPNPQVALTKARTPAPVSPCGEDHSGLVELAKDADQVAARGATGAAVIHLEHFLVGVDHQLLVDADLTELVLDDGNALAVMLAQDTVQQRRLAGSRE